jgi:glycosyltransferase involved in cell wall biosynthesis
MSHSAPAPRLLLVVNDHDFFVSHRLPIARAAADAGFDVHVAADHVGPSPQPTGYTYHRLRISRRNLRPARDLALLHNLMQLYSQVRPHLVHHVTLKPVIFGSLAARLTRVPAVVNALSGLGFTFTATGRTAELRRTAFEAAYRVATGHSHVCTIFQNHDDADLFVQRRLTGGSDVVVIRGSGVDIGQFVPHPEPAPPITVILPARLLYDKGVKEFLDAAAIVRRAKPDVRFVLVGAPDAGNPTAVAPKLLAEWRQSGTVEWWGHRGDMCEVMARCHIVCLPSYREGLPKVLLEAAASARPIVTTDVPGCRDVVRHGVNGMLVPPRDSRALAAALLTLCDDAGLRAQMGIHGRRIAEREYALGYVVAATLSVYKRLLSHEFPATS